MKTHHWIVLAIAVLIVGAMLLWPKLQSRDIYADELTGTWRAEANSEAE